MAFDANSTMRWIVEELSTTKDMIYESLERKAYTRFVPHALTETKNCSHLIVAGNETWSFKYGPQTKHQTTMWKYPGFPKSSKLPFQKSRGKTMLVCFYDSKDILHREFVPHGQNVTSAYYVRLLERLWKRIAQVRPEYRVPGSWFWLHYNAPYRTVAVRNFLAKAQVRVLQHYLYLPALPQRGYFLFPNLKLATKGMFSDNVGQIQEAVTRICEAILK
ncbi:hypothetical protein Trydic_g23786 [Trypoxylus dichotomus]